MAKTKFELLPSNIDRSDNKHCTQIGAEVNVTSDSVNASYEENPKTKFGKWMDDFNEMDVSQQSSKSSAKSPRSQIEIRKSSEFVVEDNYERLPENNSPLNFTPQDCWSVSDIGSPATSIPQNVVTPPPLVTSPWTGGSTSTPYSQFSNFQASYQQNDFRGKYSPSISSEAAQEKCSHLRRLRLQMLTKNSNEQRNNDPQGHTPRRNSLNDMRSALGWRHNSSARRARRERLSWPRSSRDYNNSYKENYSRRNSYCGNDIDTWECPLGEDGEVEPRLNSYQLLGDSLLVRFAEQVLCRQVKMVQGTRTIGLCVSGQKVMDLYRKVSMKKYPISDKVVLLIGTNDILQNTYDYDMRHTLKKLINELLDNHHVSHIVLLTIPPIPKLQDREDQWQRIETYNTYIRSLKGTNISIADISRLYLEDSRTCKLECFEKFYGDSTRKDLIHLNNHGLMEIHNYLMENNFLT